MMEPIRPDEVCEEKLKRIPESVIAGFNDMIARNWNGSSSKFKQDDVVRVILTRMNIRSRTPHTDRYLFDNKFLDVEDIYREQGWIVDYNKPEYNETYSATFEFSK